MGVSDKEMKLRLAAETKQFKKDLKESQGAVKDFHKTCDNSLSSIGDQFGINTAKVSQLANTIRGLGAEMAQCGNAGAEAFGKALMSVSKLSAGIAAMGIAGAIAGFKQLSSEVDDFHSKLAGANLELQTKAYIDTFHDAFNDINAGTTQALAMQKRSLKELGGEVKTIASFIAGDKLLSIFGKKKSASVAEIALTRVAASGVAEQARSIQAEIFNLTRQQKDQLVEISRLNAEIAVQREIAADAEATSATRMAASLKAEELINQKYDMQLPVVTKLAEKIAEMNSLTDSTAEEIDKENEARIAANNIEMQRANELRAIGKQQTSVRREVEKEAAARREIQESIMNSRLMLLDWGLNKTSDTSMPAGGAAQMQREIKLNIVPKIEEKNITDISQQINSLVTSVAETTSEAVGVLVGDLITGGDAWSNFSNAAISAFGDMAISVGKMAISTGVATLGIKKALESLNGYVAIAAGAALVALGSAVKTGLGNIASGNYSASSGVASGGYSRGGSYGSGYASQNIKVKVSGKLVAQGSSLVAVIENEGKRMNATT